MRWTKHKWKIIASVLVIAVLAAAFYIGGDAPASKGWETVGDTHSASSVQEAFAAESFADTSIASDESSTQLDPIEASGEPNTDLESPSPSQPAPIAEAEDSSNPAMDILPETGKDPYQTDPVPAGKPLPAEPQDVSIGNQAYTCTLSISCATILDNLELCDPDKVELVPGDGWILEPTTVTFYEGESVFNVLMRTCKQQKIHMEYEDTPIYNSAYIEGIHNLYEFDAGELSGWMYKVNGWFPNYGCSRYQLQDGDAICWLYTCDLGADIGGGNSTGNQSSE